MAESDKSKLNSTSHFSDNLGQMIIAELPGAIPVGQTALPIMPSDVAFADLMCQCCGRQTATSKNQTHS